MTMRTSSGHGGRCRLEPIVLGTRCSALRLSMPGGIGSYGLTVGHGQDRMPSLQCLSVFGETMLCHGGRGPQHVQGAGGGKGTLRKIKTKAGTNGQGVIKIKGEGSE
ncbi:hypothetical protein AAFF_G00153580 [Aldrovandia affinis]|uniref:Uncharacterized protein n=1 Tax=Aldrovandia affinis TaxID=143900 RepID=A0AAD7WWL3_9TELE|nr:hypothetical protein AAFF_G00153580 [Aldrovandia affinis]